MHLSRDQFGGTALVVAGLAFLFACVTPALGFHKTYADGGTATLYGYGSLIMGPLGLLSLQPAWLANIFIPVGGFLLLMRAYRGALFWSSLALGLALSTFMLFGHEVPVGEGGAEMSLDLLHGGYWLWVLCPAALFVGSWECAQMEKKEAEEIEQGA